MTTLKKLLFTHKNNYGFDPVQALSFEPKEISYLSVIIPYFETGNLINNTLRHLYNSLNNVKDIYKEWRFEVILIDDGSINKPVSKYLSKKKYPNLQILKNKTNQGRTTTRNKGLYTSKYKLCLFMDSDVLIDSQLILNHLKIHAYINNGARSKAITVSFFEFGDNKDPRLKFKTIHPVYLRLNDYRLHCVYGPTWIGCEKDKKYIGKEFRIVEETNNFRDWHGMYKAWALTNMVLGGFFMADRLDSIKVGGFNKSFKGYGFTETSLPTKLIAIKKHFLVPVLIGGGLHIDDGQVNVSRKDKDRIFWQKHDFYFNKYLLLTPDNAIKDKI